MFQDTYRPNSIRSPRGHREQQLFGVKKAELLPRGAVPAPVANAAPVKAPKEDPAPPKKSW